MGKTNLSRFGLLFKSLYINCIFRFLLHFKLNLKKFPFFYFQPFLNKRLKIHDTCGVHNLHGMPALVAAIGGAIAAALATEKKYGKE